VAGLTDAVGHKNILAKTEPDNAYFLLLSTLALGPMLIFTLETVCLSFCNLHGNFGGKPTTQPKCMPF
jgi:hypothetical protein